MFWRSQSMLPPMPFKLMARSQGHAQHAMWPHVVTLFCTCASLWPWAVLFNSECRFEAWARRPKHGISEVFVLWLCQQLKVLFFDVLDYCHSFVAGPSAGCPAPPFENPGGGCGEGNDSCKNSEPVGVWCIETDGNEPSKSPKMVEVLVLLVFSSKAFAASLKRQTFQ